MIDFGLDPSGRSKPVMLRDLSEYLVDQRLAGRMILLVIDEAQNLTLAALEELRMLSNLETEKSKLLQIVLVGQPTLRDKLAAPELEQLRQRITVSYHLNPLDAEETTKYINHRLRRAALGTPLEFPPDVTEVIHTRSRGVPRIINVICDATLVFGYAEEQRQIDLTLMRDVLIELEATGVLPAARAAEEKLAETAVVAAGAVSHAGGPVSLAAGPAVSPIAPAPVAPARETGPSYVTARAMLEEAKARSARVEQREQVLQEREQVLQQREYTLQQREQTVQQRERELADQRRVLAEEYRLLRTQRPAATAPASTPAAAATPTAPARNTDARFTAVRHETVWGRIKRAMVEFGRFAVGEN
jgi:hypothetical protein